MMNIPALHIRLFGLLELALDKRPLPAPRSSKTRLLLAYLIVHRDRPFARNVLAGSFWPDRPDGLARHALSNALWQIRQSLGPAVDRLTVEPDSVTFTLSSADWLDIAAFDKVRRCVNPRLPAPPCCLDELGKAVTLYRGDLLEECYDDWALIERERLRELYMRALERLVHLHKQRGAHSQALTYAQRLAAVDPLREAAHQELMRLYHLLNRPRAALEQFDALRDLLEQELGVLPTPTTVALRQEVAAALEKTAPPHLPIAPPPPPLLRDLAHLPLVGRVDERAALLDALQSTVQGRGGLALVEGDAGVGKTRLVDEIVADSKWRGFQVGLGKADPLAALTPYQLLRDALALLLTPLRVAQLAELLDPVWLNAAAIVLPVITEHLPDLPQPVPLEPHKERRRLWEGLSRCLVGLASAAPLLLVLEDLHWADEATLAMLSHLARRLPTERVFAILTCRTAEARDCAIVWETLKALDHALPLLRVRLSPFERAEGVALVQRALDAGEKDAQADAFARRLQDETGGNAFFLLEMLKSLLEDGSLAPASEGGWHFPARDLSLPVPALLQDLVGKRIACLTPKLRAVLELLAVLGEDADFSLLCQVSDAKAVDLTEQLGRLDRRGFLTETRTNYRFGHDLVRNVVYNAIDLQRRQTLHCRSGDALETLCSERVESLAFHFSQGGVWDKAARYSLQAGNQARAMYANHEAVAHYARALEAMDRQPGSASAVQRFELLLAREAVYGLQGEREAQAAELAALAGLAEQLDDDRRRARVALRQAGYAEVISDYTTAIAIVQEAIILAQTCQAFDLETRGYHLWGLALWRQGDYGMARSQLQQALDRARAAQIETSLSLEPQPETLGRGHRQTIELLRWIEADSLRNLSIVCYYQGDYGQARPYATQSLQMFRAIGDQVGASWCLNNLGNLSLYQGLYPEAEDYYRQSLAIKRKIGDRLGESNPLNNLGIIFLEQGYFIKAKACLEESLLLCREIGNRQGEANALISLGLVSWSLGDYGTAQLCLDPALLLSREIGDRQSEAWALAYLSLLSHRQSDYLAAQEYSQQVLRIAQDLGNRSMQGYALTNLGHALASLGALRDAAAAYRQAVAIRRDLGRHNLAIESLAGLARACLSLDDKKQAQQLVEQILDHLATGDLSGVEEPFRVYLTCCRVLAATCDSRAADFVNEAYERLTAQAAKVGDETLQRSFLENVAENRAIITIHRLGRLPTSLNKQTVRLPHAGAPTGRSLRDDEYVAVTWTLSAPLDKEIKGKIARRRQRILRLLREAAEQSAAPTVAALADALGVSARTIKRDLAALRAAGYAVSTRGSH